MVVNWNPAPETSSSFCQASRGVSSLNAAPKAVVSIQMRNGPLAERSRAGKGFELLGVLVAADGVLHAHVTPAQPVMESFVGCFLV